jgi:hypothetical protein
MRRNSNEGTNTPVHVAASVETSEPGGDIPLSPWKYKMPYFRYRKR